MNFILKVLFLTFVLYCTCPAVEQVKFNDKEFNTENVSRDIEKLGLTSVLGQIHNSPILQTTLLENIKSGKSEWLRMFELFRQEPEAEWGGQMDWALAYALEANPELALVIIKKYDEKYREYFQENLLPSYASVICGNVHEDWAVGCAENGKVLVIGGDSFQSLVLRQKSLELVTDVELQKVKEECLKRVIKAKSFWLKFSQQQKLIMQNKE